MENEKPNVSDMIANLGAQVTANMAGSQVGAPEQAPETKEAPVQEEAKPVVETKPAAKPEEKKEPEHRLWANASRAEKQAKQKLADAESRAKAIEEKERLVEAKLAANAKRLEILDKSEKDPSALLELLLEDGRYTIDDLVNKSADVSRKVKQNPKPDPVTARLDALEKQLKEKERLIEEQEEERAKNNLIATVENALNKDNEKFELVRMFSSAEDVAMFIANHYAETKKIIEADEACARMEAELEESLKKIKSIKKLKTLLGESGDPTTVKNTPKENSISKNIPTTSLPSETDVPNRETESEAEKHKKVSALIDNWFIGMAR